MTGRLRGLVAAARGPGCALTPVREMPVGSAVGPAGAAMVANGDQHILVLRPDGRVLAQGYNAEGQLGL